jgi:hypothetical protein
MGHKICIVSAGVLFLLLKHAEKKFKKYLAV